MYVSMYVILYISIYIYIIIYSGSWLSIVTHILLEYDFVRIMIIIVDENTTSIINCSDRILQM